MGDRLSKAHRGVEMPIRTYKPTSPGRRFQTVQVFDEITETRPHRPLTEPLKKTGGRNNRGEVTSRWRGGGHKRMYRIIDFRRDKKDIPAHGVDIEYDPNRSARIALIGYADGEKRYILAPAGLKAGDDACQRRQRRAEGGQLPAADEDSARACRSTTSRCSRAAGSSAGRPGVGATLTAREGDWAPDHPALGRGPPHPGRVPGDDRHGRQRRSHERPPGQGRPRAAGWAAGRTSAAWP